MELVEESLLTSNLTQEGSWSEGGNAEAELVGESQAVAASPVTAAHQGSARPWPLILAFVTFAVDMIAVLVSTYLAKSVAHGVGWDSGKPLVLEWPIFLTAAVWPVIFAIYGLYDLRRPTHATAELQRLFNAILMSVLLIVLITFIGPIEISRSFVVWLLGFSLVTVVTGRLITRRLGHSLNAHAVTSQVTLIAGTNDEARALARTLMRRPWMGYRICGFVEVAPSGLEVMDGLPVFGTVDNIAQITRDHAVRSVIIAGSAAGGATLQSIELGARCGRERSRVTRARKPRRCARHSRADRRHGALLVAASPFLAPPAIPEAQCRYRSHVGCHRR